MRVHRENNTNEELIYSTQKGRAPSSSSEYYDFSLQCKKLSRSIIFQNIVGLAG